MKKVLFLGLLVLMSLLVACGGDEGSASEPAAVDETANNNAGTLSQSTEPEPVATEPVVVVEGDTAEPIAETSNIVQQGTIIPGVEQEGLATGGYYAYTAVNAIAGQTYNIYVTPEQNLDIVLDVVDPNGNSILPSGVVDQSYEAEAIENLTFEKTGTYYISVTPFETNAEGYYTVRLENASAPTTAVEAPADPTVWEYSGLVSYGSDVEGFIPASGRSYASFSGQPGEVVNIFVTPRDGLDVVVDVIDASGNSLLFDGAVDLSLGEEVVTGVAIPVDSIYTVLVTEFNGASGYYDLRVAEISGAGASGNEYGAIFGGAGPHDRIEGPVTPGGPYTGTIPEFGAASVWGIRLFPNDVLGVRVDPLNGQDVVIDIREGVTGQSIFEGGPHDLELGSELITGLVFPNGGDYSIVIYGFTPDDVGQYELYLIEGE